MVAFASEDEAPRTAGLRLWAAMPPQNPANSTLAGPALAGQADFALARGYLWPALGAGVCPAAQSPDTDGYLDVTMAPEGVVARYLGDGLAGLWDPMFGTPPADVSTGFSFVNTHVPQLGRARL